MTALKTYLAAVLIGASALLAALSPGTGLAQEEEASDPTKEQFIPILIYRTGPFAAGGSGIMGGFMDYLTLVNEREGGVNGIKLTWEECETAYKTERGVECYERLKNKGLKGATVVHPLSTGITYALIERATKDKIPIVSLGYGRTDASDGRVFPYVFPLITNYWNQTTAKLKFIAERMGGMDEIEGMKVANLHLDHPYGRETRFIWDKLAEKYGFEVQHFPVPWPGIDQKSLWLQIRQYQPDWVINRNWGVSCTVPLREAARIGFPRDHIIGVWWCGSEEDVVPAAKAAEGYITANFHSAGRDIPVIQDIFEHVYGKMLGNVSSTRVGSVYYNRGVIFGLVTVEAIRVAHAKYGIEVISGEQMQWALEHLDITAERIKQLGAEGLLSPFKTSCLDHEGGGGVRFQQWDGEKWSMITDWIEPMHDMVRSEVEASAAKYAEEIGITPRVCE